MGRPVSTIFKDPAVVERLVALAAAGNSQGQIADILGCKVSVVYHACVRLSVKTAFMLNRDDAGTRVVLSKPRKYPHEPLPESYDDRVREGVGAGKSYGDMAKWLGVSKGQIRGALRRLGLKTHGAKLAVRKRSNWT